MAECVCDCTQVTVVDASNLSADFASADLVMDRQLASTSSDQRSITHLLIDQIEFADVLILNKTDLVTKQDVGKLEALLSKLNPAAHVITSRQCEVPLDQVLNTKR